MSSYRPRSRSPPCRRYREGHRYGKSGRDQEHSSPSTSKPSNVGRSGKVMTAGGGSDRRSSSAQRHYAESPEPKKRKVEQKSPSQAGKSSGRDSRQVPLPNLISGTPSYTCWSLPKLYYTKDGTPIAATTKALHSEFSEKLLLNIPADFRLSRVTGGSESSSAHQEQRAECSMELSDGDQLASGSLSAARPPNAVLTESQPTVDSMDTSLGRVELLPSFSARPLIHQSLPFNTPSDDGCKGGYAHMEEDGGSLHSYHCYSVAVTPDVNFKFETGSCITSAAGTVYRFDGFLLFSAASLEQVPGFTFQRYGGSYKMSFKEQSLPMALTMADLLLLEDYIFCGLLELYDWIKELRGCARDVLFLPCFARRKENGESEVLSVAEVLRHLLQSYVPLNMHIFGMKEREASSYERYGPLVSNPAKRPACLRVDHLKVKTGKLVHFYSQVPHSSDTAEEQLVADQAAQISLQRKRSEGKLKQKDFYKLKELNQKAKRRSLQTDHNKGSSVTLECDGFFSTGLHFDIVQHALLLPLVASNITFHKSLLPLEEKLLYNFKDHQFLHRCLTHPSFTGSPFYGTNEQQIKTAMSNCGVNHPESLHTQSTPKNGDPLLAALESGADESARLENSEQLEFLGDAVLEFACSIHLFNMLPSDTVGQLTTYRRALVRNKHLSEIAASIGLKHLIRRSGKMDLHEESLVRFAANCLEAIFGAVFLDGGFEEVDKLIARLFFPKEDLYQAWMRVRLQPLQLRDPLGDRELVEKDERLQRMLPLEDSTGVKFTNICLLAQAFTHSSCVDTELIMGNYQRMEYLGDAILQFLTSRFVYLDFPSQHEGHLSMLRTCLVHNKLLSKLCGQLGFKQFIITSTTENVPLTGKILADVVESFLAALYLDKGFKYAECFLETVLFPKLEDIIRKSEVVDSTVHLQQAVVYTCRRRNMAIELPIYRTLNVRGPQHKSEYTVAAYFKEKRIGKGVGHSLREARKKAAENALTHNGGCLILPPLLQKSLQ